MKRYSIHLFITLFSVAGLVACTKKELLSEKFHYGNVTFMLLNLPNTPATDIYVEGRKKLEFLTNSLNIRQGDVMVVSDQDIKVSAYRAGTKTLIADTVIRITKNVDNTVKLACSDDLGISRFVSDKSTISQDSCSFQLYNSLPVDLLPDGVSIDVYLFNADGTETGIVFSNVVKNKLHPVVQTVPVRTPDGMDISYIAKFKDRATGQFLPDKRNRDNTAIAMVPGKFIIATLTGKVQIGKLLWSVNIAEL
jgi:hypothetical protein